MTNPVDQARQYLADGKSVLWTDVDLRPMVEGLLEEIEENKKTMREVRSGLQRVIDRNYSFMNTVYNSLNVRMADIREEGPSLLRRVKNWWRNR
jgi:hypothetical protein